MSIIDIGGQNRHFKMQIVFKNFKKEKFPIDVEPTDTVSGEQTIELASEVY